MLFGSIVSLVAIDTVTESYAEMIGEFPSWARTAIGMLTGLNIAGLIATYLWKRWGVYAVLVANFATAGIYVATGIPAFSLVGSFITLALYILLVRSAWDSFR